jgi:hypothetical protein
MKMLLAFILLASCANAPNNAYNMPNDLIKGNKEPDMPHEVLNKSLGCPKTIFIGIDPENFPRAVSATVADYCGSRKKCVKSVSYNKSINHYSVICAR